MTDPQTGKKFSGPSHYSSSQT